MSGLASHMRLQRRTGVTVVAACLLIAVSYGASIALHQHAVVEVGLARAAMARGEWAGATEHLNRALRADWFLVDAHLLRATAINKDMSATNIWLVMQSSAQAVADTDHVLRFRPNSGDAHYQRALALRVLGKERQALEELTRAISLMEVPTEALADRAALSFQLHDHESAIRDISEAIARRPGSVEFEEAREHYRRFADIVRASH